MAVNRITELPLQTFEINRDFVIIVKVRIKSITGNITLVT